MRGRGIDFEQRFNASRWAEDLLLLALNGNPGVLAARFGLSKVRSNSALRTERWSRHKEPDLLVYRKSALTPSQRKALKRCELQAVPRDRLGRPIGFNFALRKAAAAIEVEFSPYRAKEMRGRYWQPKSREQWRRRPLRTLNPPIAPNIFVKAEDLPRLSRWEARHRIPVYVVHVFDQEAFGCRLSLLRGFARKLQRAKGKAETRRLQHMSGIFLCGQDYDRIDAQGASEKKEVFRVHPSAAIKVGEVRGVRVVAQWGLSSSGKYVSQIAFRGGVLNVESDFLSALLAG